MLGRHHDGVDDTGISLAQGVLDCIMQDNSQECGRGGAGHCAGDSMVEDVSPARVFVGAKALVEAFELPGFQRIFS
jgi:hypothetical protein